MINIKKHIFISFILALLSLTYLLLSSISLSNPSVNTKVSNIIYKALSTPPFLLELMSALLVISVVHLILSCLASFINISIKRIPFNFYISWILIVITIVIGNSTFYPLTLFSISTNLPLYIFPTVLTLCVILAFIGIVRTSKKTKTITFIILTLTLISEYNLEKINIQESSKSIYPNIIIIGVDSLRPDAISPNLTPYISSFIKSNGRVTNITTPNARTFPSWYSLLSGKSPVNSGARFNLTKEDNLSNEGSLQKELKTAGYKTIYAQDERRFNNIGTSFGFDEAIGPPANAAEFVLSNLSNLPQIALAVNFSFIHDIFPYIKGNRAAYTTYEPNDFTNQIKNKLKDNKKPLFLAAHFTLPHHPFMMRLPIYLNDEKFDSSQPYDYLYKTMLYEVDSQVYNTMKFLSNSGYLNNAIIILLSDHGESFGTKQDGPINAIHESNFITNSQGHGTNVLSHSQFNVLLSISNKGASEHCKNTFLSNDEFNYSLIDIKPSILKCLSIEDKQSDGIPINEVTHSRVTYNESSINPIVTSNNIIDELQTIANGVYFYTIDKNGKLIVKPEVFLTALSTKQRSIISGNYKLASFPSMMDDLIIVNLKENLWYPASHFEDKELVKNMFLNLCEHYIEDVNNKVFKQCEEPLYFLNRLNIF